MTNAPQKFSGESIPFVVQFVRDYFRNNFNTTLSPKEEQSFLSWVNGAKSKYGVELTGDLDAYDLRGYYGERGEDDSFARRESHATDTYKKPNHPTFSDESKYHGSPRPGGGAFEGGRWAGEQFIPADRNKLLSVLLPLVIGGAKR